MIQPAKASTKYLRSYLYLTAFVSGMVSLGLEVSVSRLMAPHFGDSLLVWATIIGLILLYLTLGYFIGGRWADRPSPALNLYKLICWAALFMGLAAFAFRPFTGLLASVLGLSSRYGLWLLVGPFLAGSFFSAPVILMGCVSPFVVRMLLERLDVAGNVSGRVYAVSTAGSILGTFLPVFLLIPVVGTRNSVGFLSLILMTVGLLGLATVARHRALAYLWMPLPVILLMFTVGNQPINPLGARRKFESESSYHYVQVVENQGKRYLQLNEGLGVQSVYWPGHQLADGYWDYFLLAPFFNPYPFSSRNVRSMAIIGLGAGTIPKQYTAFFGPIPIDGVELDPEVVRVGRAFFEMNEPNLNVIAADGRSFLASSDRHYTVIGIDAYRVPYIPWDLTTVEFFHEVRQHLTDDGVVVVNIERFSDDRQLEEAIASTLAHVFTSVITLDVPDSSNTLLVGTIQPGSAQNLVKNRAVMESALLQGLVDRVFVNVGPAKLGAWVLTDDWAPVERFAQGAWLEHLLSIH